jgi:orotidine-5'-phosphate decarboxylase
MTHDHASQLIYAADPSFFDCADIKAAHIKAAGFLEETTEALRDTGIVIKGNTLFRFLGNISMCHIAAVGLKIFADYKLFDVQDTCSNDFSWLRLIPNVEILTICERVHPAVFQAAAEMLPNTTIAPIYPLTDLKDEDFASRGEKDRTTAVSEFFRRVERLPSTGVISSPYDLTFAPLGFTFENEPITPAIRPEWFFEPGDKNAINALTPRKAILAGAKRLVIGSPLRKNGELYDNAMRILDEIGEATIELNSK